MNKQNFAYAQEKLRTAVRTLIVGSGSLQDRLKSAFDSFHTLTEENFPTENIGDYQWVINRLTADRTDQVDHVLESMTEQQAIDVAHRIVDLAWTIEDALRDYNQ